MRFSSLYSDILFILAGEYHTDTNTDRRANDQATRRRGDSSLVIRVHKAQRNPGTQEPASEEKPHRERSRVDDSESRFAGLKRDTRSELSLS